MHIPKRWFRSRTIAVNALVAALAVAETQFHILQPHLPGNVYAWIAFALPVVNVILRTLTTRPVGK